MRLFCHKKLDLGICGWGLLFEHIFTGKKCFAACVQRTASNFWHYQFAIKKYLVAVETMTFFIAF